MARTYRNDKYTQLYSKERKEYRKAHYQSDRVKVKQLIKMGLYDDIPRLRKTSGWLTW